MRLLPRTWLLLLLLPMLTACMPSQRQVLRARHMVSSNIEHGVSCQRRDHCAADSGLYALAAQGKGNRNQAVILDLGEDALIARLNLIRAARQSISIQTYIWANDDAGKLMLDALVAAARRGVHVRILADQLASFNDLEQLATLARTHVNFELRLYNPTLQSAETGAFGYFVGGLCCFSNLNQRMHNKLFLVDGHIGITGGRNYENRYFDWDSDFNFLDRDILVAGPVAQDMRASFFLFWNHPRAVKLTLLRDVSAQLIRDGPDAPGWQPPRYERADRVQRVLEEAADPAYIKSHFLLRAKSLKDVEYFADRPGKTDNPSKRERELTAHLMNLVSTASQEIILQTPYLVISDRGQRIFRKLQKERSRVRILISTNSLASTDAFAVYAVAHKYVRRYLAVFNFNIYEQKPHPVDAPRMIAHYNELSGSGARVGNRGRYSAVPLTTSGVRVSLHAKSMVVDKQYVMIGSHNFDPRSDDYNTECGIIIHDRDFARVVRASILATIRPGNSWVVAKRQVNGMVGRINRALAKLSAALPIFDLWPFGYATSYQLKPGCPVMRREDPRFYACYEPVGEFPEVALPLKTIYTRIITGFGAGMSDML
ncbi:MAG: phospholipase D family protein [Rhodanobacteraceae bacterium]